MYALLIHVVVMLVHNFQILLLTSPKASPKVRVLPLQIGIDFKLSSSSLTCNIHV